MNSELKAILDAWDNRDAAGPRSSQNAKGLPQDGTEAAKGDDKVRKLADAYVKKHSDEFAGFDNLTEKVCVTVYEDHRDSGRDDDAARMQVWLWHKFEPQNIGGEVDAKVRIPNG